MRINFFFFSETRRTRRAVSLATGLAMIFALLLLFGLQAANPANAATRPPLTVNSADDWNDLDFPDGAFDGSSDGKCDVDSITTGDQCTLRAAIQEANKLAGADTIAFNFPGSGTTGIITDSALPTITQRLTIDGYTQPGATPNTIPLAKDGTNAVLKIGLHGDATSSHSGLSLHGPGASNSVIRGLVIQEFPVGINLASGTGYKVEGNFIGTNFLGTAATDGNGAGVILHNADGSTIGGTASGARNLISGNGSEGVGVETGSAGNKIQGNLIGTDKTGTADLGNSFFGVFFLNASNKNIIGDSDPTDGLTNAANVIAFNSGYGIGMLTTASTAFTSTGNRILSNSIFSNGDGVGEDLGIDLSRTVVSDGVTPNDPKDPDTGPNNLQNYPLITAHIFDDPFFGETAIIGGELDSTPSTRKKKRTFIVQFFSSPNKDTSNHGEGKTFLGQIQVTTDRQGNAPINFSTRAASEGEYITATATNRATGDTSEFSEAKVLEPPGAEG